jgi:cell wall-associated NlpC family hydrolase
MKALLLAACIVVLGLTLISSVTVMPLGVLMTVVGAGRNIPPGHVPPEAMPAPEGPMLSDTSDLASLVQPWMRSRYVFGGNVIGAVDCSGFTVAVFRQVGVQLPRTAQLQYNVASHVSAADAQPWDLVFFAGTYDARPDWITHVGIYLGDGVMVSAIEPELGRQNLNSPYWRSHFVSFGRVRR